VKSATAYTQPNNKNDRRIETPWIVVSFLAHLSARSVPLSLVAVFQISHLQTRNAQPRGLQPEIFLEQHGDAKHLPQMLPSLPHYRTELRHRYRDPSCGSIPLHAEQRPLIPLDQPVIKQPILSHIKADSTNLHREIAHDRNRPEQRCYPFLRLL
jgi:hypothetical protein